jgi:thioredoxin-like negative regulator of GroEL
METLQTISTPNDLLAQAIDKGLTVEALEKLVALQERWEAGQARKAFFDAFTTFQSEAPDLRKTKSVSFGKEGGKTEYK